MVETHESFVDRVADGMMDDAADIGRLDGAAIACFSSEEDAPTPVVTNIFIRKFEEDGVDSLRVFMAILALFESTVSTQPKACQDDWRKWMAERVLSQMD